MSAEHRGSPLQPLWDRLEPYARRGPFREDAFRSPMHTERTAAILGIALGVTFSVCFATGMLSSLIQRPPTWFTWPSRPAGLYRVTQGVHVATGLASIPLLLAKLWAAYPRLFAWPPVRSFPHALERLSLVPLVGGSLFLLYSGTANIAGWYPWPFGFIQAHHAAAWITIGALVVHVGSKLPAVRRQLFGVRSEDAEPASPDVREGEVYEDAGLSRRGFIASAFGASALVAAVTAGQTFPPLRRLTLLAPRHPGRAAPQGVPVNRTAVRAGVGDLARDAGFRLVVDGQVERPLELTMDELRSMEPREAELPIACVEGWSASAMWGGVPVRDLLSMAGAPDGANVTVHSIEPRGPYRTSELNRYHAHDPDTLLAMTIGGEPLSLDHGFPLRLIGPNRPGVMQTKWVGRLEVHTDPGRVSRRGA